MTEKPRMKEAPSNLIILGGYIPQPEIFGILTSLDLRSGGEVQIADALLGLMQTKDSYDCHFRGRSSDCADKAGFLSANVAFALSREGPRWNFAKAMIDVLHNVELSYGVWRITAVWRR